MCFSGGHGIMKLKRGDEKERSEACSAWAPLWSNGSGPQANRSIFADKRAANIQRQELLKVGNDRGERRRAYLGAQRGAGQTVLYKSFTRPAQEVGSSSPTGAPKALDTGLYLFAFLALVLASGLSARIRSRCGRVRPAGSLRNERLLRPIGSRRCGGGKYGGGNVSGIGRGGICRGRSWGKAHG